MGNIGRLREAVLCQCTIGKPVIHAIDFLTNLEADRILTHGRNDAGELMARNGVAPALAVLGMRGGIPQQFRRRHTSSIDTD